MQFYDTPPDFCVLPQGHPPRRPVITRAVPGLESLNVKVNVPCSRSSPPQVRLIDHFETLFMLVQGLPSSFLGRPHLHKAVLLRLEQRWIRLLDATLNCRKRLPFSFLASARSTRARLEP